MFCFVWLSFFFFKKKSSLARSINPRNNPSTDHLTAAGASCWVEWRQATRLGLHFTSPFTSQTAGNGLGLWHWSGKGCTRNDDNDDSSSTIRAHGAYQGTKEQVLTPKRSPSKIEQRKRTERREWAIGKGPRGESVVQSVGPRGKGGMSCRQVNLNCEHCGGGGAKENGRSLIRGQWR